MLRKVRNLAVVGVLVAGGLTGIGTPAFAASAPSCIDVTGYSPTGTWGPSVYMVNECGKTEKVKVVISDWPDGPCHTMSAGADYGYTASGGYFDYVASC